MEDILKDRELKQLKIKELVDSLEFKTVCSLHCNIPGNNKNIKSSKVIINYINRLIVNTFNPDYSELLCGIDGDMYLYGFKNIDSMTIKTKMIEIEEGNELGRFVDLDVYSNDTYKSLNRSKLRKCYLCNNPAFVCGRNKTHSIDELNDFIDKSLFGFLGKINKSIIYESILAELDLSPKFGLVTPDTNGSHKDMNYSLMKKSIDGFINELNDMFYVGYNSQKDLKNDFDIIREIGKNAENKMLKETSGINTYKGLIFDLGIITYAVGYSLNNKDLKLIDIIKEMTKGLCDELVKIKKPSTFGEMAYINYGIKGARYEAEVGFKDVFNIIKKYNLNNKIQLFTSLCELIGCIDDTVLLKRCVSIDQYRDVQKRFRCLDINNIEEVNKLNDYCITNNLSFGGAADLLICAYYIQTFDKIIQLNI